MKKYSVFLGNLGTCNERHCPSYTNEKFTYEQLFERAASIELIEGVDLVSDAAFWENYDVVKSSLIKYDLKAVSIVVDLFGKPIWKQGSLSSISEDVRQQAIEAGKKTKDAAEELGCEFITIWPGQDGYDYMFQADYMQERNGLQMEFAKFANTSLKLELHSNTKSGSHVHIITSALWALQF